MNLSAHQRVGYLWPPLYTDPSKPRPTLPPELHPPALRAGDRRASPRLGSIQFLIASCNSHVETWASPLLDGFAVLVLEQCEPSQASNSTAPSLPTLRVPHCCGREAWSYMYYVISHWHDLPEYMIFLQSDAPKHSGEFVDSRAAVESFVRQAQERHVTFRAMSRVSHRPAGPHTYQCSIFQLLAEIDVLHGVGNLTLDAIGHSYKWKSDLAHYTSLSGKGCPHAWTTSTRAQFVVSAAAIRSRPLQFYQAFALYFITPWQNGTSWQIDCNPLHVLHSISAEYVWGLIFRCSLVLCTRPRPGKDSQWVVPTACRRPDAFQIKEPQVKGWVPPYQHGDALAEVGDGTDPLTCTRLHF